jgi:recombination protein RecA
VRLGQGRENSKEYLTQHIELSDELEAQIRGAQRPATVQPLPATDGVSAEEDEPEEL